VASSKGSHGAVGACVWSSDSTIAWLGLEGGAFSKGSHGWLLSDSKVRHLGEGTLAAYESRLRFPSFGINTWDSAFRHQYAVHLGGYLIFCALNPKFQVFVNHDAGSPGRTPISVRNQQSLFFPLLVPSLQYGVLHGLSFSWYRVCSTCIDSPAQHHAH
jgi:hypothetical protein